MNSFKTQSKIIEKEMPRVLGNNQHKAKTVVAVDCGYSAVKGVGQHRIYIFPSFVKKASKNFQILGELKDTDIIVKDNNTGDTYFVGELAYVQMTQTDAKSMTDEQLYDRYRYNSLEFQICMGVGIALGLPKNYKDTDIIVQTGLPSAYKNRDSQSLIDATKHPYDLSIKVGNNPYVDYKFTPSEVSVMEQPMGTLFAILHNIKGEMIPERANILKSASTIIYDIGFGTEDLCVTRNGIKEDPVTYSDTAMKSVFDLVVSELNNQTFTPVKSFELQKSLDNNIYHYYDRNERKTVNIDIAPMLEKYNLQLAKKSLDRLMSKYNDLDDFNYLICTGGTCESRFEYIDEALKGASVQVLPSNVNDTSISCVFSNVIGYYLYMVASLKAKEKS